MIPLSAPLDFNALNMYVFANIELAIKSYRRFDSFIWYSFMWRGDKRSLCCAHIIPFLKESLEIFITLRFWNNLDISKHENNYTESINVCPEIYIQNGTYTLDWCISFEAIWKYYCLEDNENFIMAIRFSLWHDPRRDTLSMMS